MRLLARLSPAQRAWVLYDAGNSLFVTNIITAIFPIYYAKVASAGVDPSTTSLRYSLTTTVALAIAAVLGPLVGVWTDAGASRARLLRSFVGFGAAATLLLTLVTTGDWLLATVLFACATVGLNLSFVVYDSLLPHVAAPAESDRISSLGFALGYFTGGVFLALSLALIMQPAWFGLADAGTLPTRLTFGAVALLWFGSCLPLARVATGLQRPMLTGAARAGELLRSLARAARELPRHRNAFILLVAFLIYNDGIGTIIRMAAVYGTELGLPSSTLIGAILMVQFVGIPCTLLFSALAGRIGTRNAVLLGVMIYGVIAWLGYRLETERDFWILGLLVALVQGGTQALSRSLFARLIPAERSGEFFGFFAVSEKFAGVLGPAVFAAVQWITGSSRSSVLAILAFFLIGGSLLLFVREPERAPA